jgi:hypothetical protein
MGVQMPCLVLLCPQYALDPKGPALVFNGDIHFYRPPIVNTALEKKREVCIQPTDVSALWFASSTQLLENPHKPPVTLHEKEEWLWLLVRCMLQQSRHVFGFLGYLDAKYHYNHF